MLDIKGRCVERVLHAFRNIALAGIQFRHHLPQSYSPLPFPAQIKLIKLLEVHASTFGTSNARKLYSPKAKSLDPTPQKWKPPEIGNLSGVTLHPPPAPPPRKHPKAEGKTQSRGSCLQLLEDVDTHGDDEPGRAGQHPESHTGGLQSPLSRVIYRDILA